jgi:hypothetical protein
VRRSYAKRQSFLLCACYVTVPLADVNNQLGSRPSYSLPSQIKLKRPLNNVGDLWHMIRRKVFALSIAEPQGWRENDQTGDYTLKIL